jgi:hypothetical protein
MRFKIPSYDITDIQLVKGKFDVTTQQKNTSTTRASNKEKEPQPTRLELRFLSIFLNNEGLALYGYFLSERLG